MALYIAGPFFFFYIPSSSSNSFGGPSRADVCGCGCALLLTWSCCLAAAIGCMGCWGRGVQGKKQEVRGCRSLEEHELS